MGDVERLVPFAFDRGDIAEQVSLFGPEDAGKAQVEFVEKTHPQAVDGLPFGLWQGRVKVHNALLQDAQGQGNDDPLSGERTGCRLHRHPIRAVDNRFHRRFQTDVQPRRQNLGDLIVAAGEEYITAAERLALLPDSEGKIRYIRGEFVFDAGVDKIVEHPLLSRGKRLLGQQIVQRLLDGDVVVVTVVGLFQRLLDEGFGLLFGFVVFGVFQQTPLCVVEPDIFVVGGEGSDLLLGGDCGDGVALHPVNPRRAQIQRRVGPGAVGPHPATHAVTGFQHNHFIPFFLQCGGRGQPGHPPTDDQYVCLIAFHYSRRFLFAGWPRRGRWGCLTLTAARGQTGSEGEQQALFEKGTPFRVLCHCHTAFAAAWAGDVRV